MRIKEEYIEILKEPDWVDTLFLLLGLERKVEKVIGLLQILGEVTGAKKDYLDSKWVLLIAILDCILIQFKKVYHYYILLFDHKYIIHPQIFKINFIISL